MTSTTMSNITTTLPSSNNNNIDIKNNNNKSTMATTTIATKKSFVVNDASNDIPIFLRSKYLTDLNFEMTSRDISRRILRIPTTRPEIPAGSLSYGTRYLSVLGCYPRLRNLSQSIELILSTVSQYIAQRSR